MFLKKRELNPEYKETKHEEDFKWELKAMENRNYIGGVDAPNVQHIQQQLVDPFSGRTGSQHSMGNAQDIGYLGGDRTPQQIMHLMKTQGIMIQDSSRTANLIPNVVQNNKKELEDFLTPYGEDQKGKYEKEQARKDAIQARKDSRKELRRKVRTRAISTFDKLKELYKEHVLKPTP